MILKSKFDLNQKVFYIKNDKIRKWEDYEDCKDCNGTGKIKSVAGNLLICPTCHGKTGEYKFYNEEYQIIDGEYTIGQIRIVCFSLKKTGMFDNIGEYDPDNIEYNVEYMVYEHGVGSGTVYYEKDLFATKEEAQEECNKRNKSVDILN